MNVTLICCDITIDQRWAVGTVAGFHDEVDLPVVHDPRTPGQVWLPATSVVGSLRAHLGEPMAMEWLGSPMRDYEDKPEGDTVERTALPGRLRVLGTRPITARASTRGTTAIDRGRGAADGRTLRVEESVEPTTVSLLMEYDGMDDDTLMRALALWHPVIGRGRSTGLGAARVTDVTSVTLDLGQAPHLTWWLSDRRAFLVGTQDLPEWLEPRRLGPPAEDTSPTPEAADLVVAMVTKEPIHVGVHGTGDDAPNGGEGKNKSSAQPVLRRDDGVPYIPGSSWKGVFRHRVELILDVVGASQAQREDVVTRLFGSAVVGRGLLRFHDSWFAAPQTQARAHVAIDRFTGGARDGFLFTLDSVPRQSPLNLRISGGRGGPAVENLLRHVIRDLSDGLIGVGGHGTRGYGWVAYTQDAESSPQAPAAPEPLPVDLWALWDELFPVVPTVPDHDTDAGPSPDPITTPAETQEVAP